MAEKMEKMVLELHKVSNLLSELGREGKSNKSTATFEKQGALLTEMANQLSVPTSKAYINFEALMDGADFWHVLQRMGWGDTVFWRYLALTAFALGQDNEN